MAALHKDKAKAQYRKQMHQVIGNPSKYETFSQMEQVHEAVQLGNDAIDLQQVKKMQRARDKELRAIQVQMEREEKAHSLANQRQQDHIAMLQRQIQKEKQLNATPSALPQYKPKPKPKNKIRPEPKQNKTWNNSVVVPKAPRRVSKLRDTEVLMDQQPSRDVSASPVNPKKEEPSKTVTFQLAQQTLHVRPAPQKNPVYDEPVVPTCLEAEQHLARLAEFKKQVLDNLTPAEQKKEKVKRSIVSKTAYNLISMKAKDLTEMMVDDLLGEMVELLNAAENSQRALQDQQRQKEYLQDLLDNLVDYEGTQNQVLNEFQLQQQKKERMREVQVEDRAYRRATEQSVVLIKTTLAQPVVNAIKNKKKNTDKLMKEMNEMKRLSDRILDEIYEECYQQFEQCQDEFVEKVFQAEFR